MTLLLTILHVVISLFIIGVVLLQSGKGAEVGASFGSGSSQSVFGASGGGSFLTKVTAAAATIFMLTSLTLAYLSGHAPGSTIMSGKGAQKAAPVAPAQQSAPALPAQKPIK
jgi:preprotein translocase subunit SecG